MAIDWNKVEADVLSSAKTVLQNNWNTVSGTVSGQITSLIACGCDIENAIRQNPPAITELEYGSLKLSQQRALEGIVAAYEAIGIVTAEQVASAAWNVLSSALKTAYPAIAFL